MLDKFDLKVFRESHILVIGDVMLDRYLWGSVTRISPEAPVPVFHLRRQSEIPGGAGNVVSNLAGLGCSVTVIGVRGIDQSGEIINSLLQNMGAHVNLFKDPKRPTVTKTRIVSNGQQLLRLDEEEVFPINRDIKNKIYDFVKKNIKEFNAIVLSDYGKGLLQTEDLTGLLIDTAKNYEIPIIIDPKGKDWERYQGATCVTPNLKELENLFNEPLAEKEKLVKAMETTLSKYDLNWLAVTRGALGICLMGKSKEAVIIPTVARQVYDVSGAGDTVIATMSLGLGSGLDLIESAKLANLAAGIVVGKIGTQPISLTELRASLEITGVDASTGESAYKIVSQNAAIMQVDAWKAARQKVVFTNGCFDLLHPGHIHLLNQAKNLGDRLIVAVNSDASVKRLKGNERPILGERDRASLLAALDCVDLVLLFDEDTPEKLIKTIRPNVLAKGSDYKHDEVVGHNIVEGYGGETRLIKLLDGYSTTAIANKVCQVNKRI